MSTARIDARRKGAYPRMMSSENQALFAIMRQPEIEP